MDERPAKRTPVTPPTGLSKVSSFEEVRRAGFEVYSLAAVYVYAGVPDSLPKRFAEEEHPDVRGRPRQVLGTTLHFDRPVVARCEHWNCVLDLMDKESYQWFKKWMLTLNLTRRRERKFFVTRHYIAPVLDPILLDKRGVAKPESLDVFGVCGMSGIVRPVTEWPTRDTAPRCVDFRVDPPDEDVQVWGKHAMDILTEI